MAEGIARKRYGDRATFASAGTMAVVGSAPTAAARTAAAEIDVDISELRGLSLARSVDPVPDRIYTMTERHRRQVAVAIPELADRVELLDPAGEVADPYGRDLIFYRHARDQIAAAIDRRAADWRTEQETIP